MFNNYADLVLDELAHGKYGDHIQAWIEAYGAENVVAVDSGKLRTERIQTLTKVVSQLGLDPNDLKMIVIAGVLGVWRGGAW
eukprot:scaffold269365_cov52-Prasinocladus_malaysianus.AAC.1